MGERAGGREGHCSGIILFYGEGISDAHWRHLCNQFFAGHWVSRVGSLSGHALDVMDTATAEAYALQAPSQVLPSP